MSAAYGSRLKPQSSIPAAPGVMSWQERMDKSGRRECESLAVELMQAEIAELRAALAEKPTGPTVAELQSAGFLQAFPRPIPGDDGMTLRDYFAAKALPWVLVNQMGGHLFAERAATEAYVIADALLAARGAA